MLAAIYNWFTEGFDTDDLRDAKALLEELGGDEIGAYRDVLRTGRDKARGDPNHERDRIDGDKQFGVDRNPSWCDPRRVAKPLHNRS